MAKTEGSCVPASSVITWPKAQAPSGFPTPVQGLKLWFRSAKTVGSMIISE